MFYVYFLLSLKDKSVYIGSTENLIRRFKEHNASKTRSLKSKIPLKLIRYEAYLEKTIARKREIYLKKSYQSKLEILRRLNISTGPIV